MHPLFATARSTLPPLFLRFPDEQQMQTHFMPGLTAEALFLDLGKVLWNLLPNPDFLLHKCIIHLQNHPADSIPPLNSKVLEYRQGFELSIPAHFSVRRQNRTTEPRRFGCPHVTTTKPLKADSFCTITALLMPCAHTKTPERNSAEQKREEQ